MTLLIHHEGMRRFITNILRLFWRRQHSSKASAKMAWERREQRLAWGYGVGVGWDLPPAPKKRSTWAFLSADQDVEQRETECEFKHQKKWSQTFYYIHLSLLDYSNTLPTITWILCERSCSEKTVLVSLKICLIPFLAIKPKTRAEPQHTKYWSVEPDF